MNKAKTYYNCRGKRYSVQAKRKNTNEKWTDWAAADDYESAVRHANRAKELGYSSRIIDRGENPNE